MVVTYYADVIFVWNFIVDFFLLFLIHPDKAKRYYRLAAAAVLGGGAALLMLYCSVGTFFLFFVLRFLWAGMMVAVAFPTRGIGEFFCNTALLYGISGCLYGGCALVSEMPVARKDTSCFILLVVLAGLMIGKGLYNFRKKQYRRQSFQLRIKIRSGKSQIEKTAFYDSGNHLFEPISGKPVILVRSGIMQLLEIEQERLRIVPYSSLGTNAGMLEAYPIEELVVFEGKREYQFRNIYIATAEEIMFAQEACDVILHADLGGANYSRKEGEYVIKDYNFRAD